MKDLFRQSLAWCLNVAFMKTAWWQRRLNAMGYVWHMAGLNEQNQLHRRRKKSSVLRVTGVLDGALQDR